MRRSSPSRGVHRRAPPPERVEVTLSKCHAQKHIPSPASLVVLAVPCVVVLALSTGWLRSAPVAASAPATATSSSARERYLADCAVCHGPAGKGTSRGVSLIGVGRASVDYQLSTGRMPLGPAVRTDSSGRPLVQDPNRTLPDPSATPKRNHPAYSPSQISELVDYVASLGPGGPDIPRVQPGDRAKGGELFRLQCAACHAWAGVGGALSKREAPDLHPATSVQIAEAVRVGPGQMPKFGQAALTEGQLHDLVSYVRYLDHPQNRGGSPLDYLGPVSEGAVALAAIGLVMLLLRGIGERG